MYSAPATRHQAEVAQRSAHRVLLHQRKRHQAEVQVQEVERVLREADDNIK